MNKFNNKIENRSAFESHYVPSENNSSTKKSIRTQREITKRQKFNFLTTDTNKENSSDTIMTRFSLFGNSL